MTKDQIIECIAQERVFIAEAELRVKNLLVELAKYADWQVCDIVEFNGNIFKLTRVITEDDGSVDKWGIKCAKRLKDGGFGLSRDYIYGASVSKMKLIERPEVK